MRLLNEASATNAVSLIFVNLTQATNREKNTIRLIYRQGCREFP